MFELIVDKMYFALVNAKFAIGEFKRFIPNNPNQSIHSTRPAH